MLSRRDLVGKLAASAAVIWAAGAARSSFASTRHAPSTPTGSGKDQHSLAPVPETSGPAPQVVAAELPATLSAPAPWELLHPLAMGSAVVHGWRVAGFTGAVDGSCVLTLQNGRGRAHRVHICRNDGRPQGIVYTKRFDLVVMNGGQGDLPTDEGFAQSVAEVSHVLAANEGDGRQEPIVAALLPQAERLRLYGGPADARLR
jgi:hypothetical protein